MHSQRLSYTQIQHDLLTSTRDSIRPNIPIQPLDLSTLATTTIAKTTKDLTRLSSTELESCGTLRLQASNSATEFQHGFRLAHELALVHQVLEPVVAGLDLARHMRQLEADDGVVDEFLAEGLALVRVLDAFLVADAGESDGLDDDADALVVEVCHDNFEALVLLADEILYGDLDVLKSDVGGSG